VELGAALAHDDVASNDELAAVALETQKLRVRIPAIPAPFLCAIDSSLSLSRAGSHRSALL
jgi:hypothetical protein